MLFFAVSTTFIFISFFFTNWRVLQKKSPLVTSRRTQKLRALVTRSKAFTGLKVAFVILFWIQRENQSQPLSPVCVTYFLPFFYLFLNNISSLLLADLHLDKCFLCRYRRTTYDNRDNTLYGRGSHGHTESGLRDVSSQSSVRVNQIGGVDKYA